MAWDPSQYSAPGQGAARQAAYRAYLAANPNDSTARTGFDNTGARITTDVNNPGSSFEAQAAWRAANPQQVVSPPPQTQRRPQTALGPKNRLIGDPRLASTGPVTAGPDQLGRTGTFLHGDSRMMTPGGGYIPGDPRLSGMPVQTMELRLDQNGNQLPPIGTGWAFPGNNAPMVYDAPLGGNPVGRGSSVPGYSSTPAPGGNPGAGQWPYPGAPGAPQPFNPFGGTQQGGNENRTLGQVGLDPRLDAMYSYALSQAMARYADPNGASFYGGPTVAQFNPDDYMAQALMRSGASTAAGSMGSGLGYMNTMMDRAINPQNDPVLQANINAMAKDTMQSAYDPNGVFGQIDDASLANGSFGGTRQGVAQGVAQGRLSDNISQNAAAMRLAAQQQNIGAAQAALSSVPNSLALLSAPGSMYGAVGQQGRDMQQRIYDDLLRRWAYNTTEPDRRLQNLFQMIGSAPLGGWQTGSSTVGSNLVPGANGGTSNLQNILGGISGGAALWNLLSPFFSGEG